MNRKITQLTAEQEAYLPVFRDEYLRQAIGGVPTDREELTSAIGAAYKEIGKQPPLVVVLKSPAQALVAMRVLQNIQKKAADKNFHAKLSDQFDFTLRRRIRNKIMQQVGHDVVNQLQRLRETNAAPIHALLDDLIAHFRPNTATGDDRALSLKTQLQSRLDLFGGIVTQVSPQLDIILNTVTADRTYWPMARRSRQIGGALHLGLGHQSRTLQQRLRTDLYRDLYEQIADQITPSVFSAVWSNYFSDTIATLRSALVSNDALLLLLESRMSNMPWSYTDRPSLATQILEQVTSPIWSGSLMEGLQLPLRRNIEGLAIPLEQNLDFSGDPIGAKFWTVMRDQVVREARDAIHAQTMPYTGFWGRFHSIGVQDPTLRIRSGIVPNVALKNDLEEVFLVGIWASFSRSIADQLSMADWNQTRMSLMRWLSNLSPRGLAEMETFRLARVQLRGRTYSQILAHISDQMDTGSRSQLRRDLTAPITEALDGVSQVLNLTTSIPASEWMDRFPAVGMVGMSLHRQLSKELDHRLWRTLQGRTEAKLDIDLDLGLDRVFSQTRMWNQLDDGVRTSLDEAFNDVHGIHLLPDALFDLRDRVVAHTHLVRSELRGDLARKRTKKLFIPQTPWQVIISHIAEQVISHTAARLDQIAREQAQILLQEKLADMINAELQSDTFWNNDLYNSNYLWGSQDLYWIAWGKFAEHIGVQLDTDTSRRLEIMRRIGFQCEWWWPYEGICFASERPKVRFDAQQRLHSEVGPAIEYGDGYSLYFWHGTNIPAHWIEDRANIDPAEVIRARNVEQRAAGAAICGWPKMLRVLEERIIDQHPNPSIGALIELWLPGLDQPGRFLKAHCPRNGLIVEGVPRNSDINGEPINTAIAAQAWRIGVPSRSFKIPPRRT